MKDMKRCVNTLSIHNHMIVMLFDKMKCFR